MSAQSELIARLGLKPAKLTLQPKRRLLVSSVGWMKCGKTFWGLRAPKSKKRPLLALDYDTGMEELLEQPVFAEDVTNGLIYREDMRVAEWGTQLLTGELTDATVKAAQDNVARFIRLYRETLMSGEFHSIFIDNGHALLQAFRAARLGKRISVFGGVDPKQYGPVNSEFEELLKLAMDYNTNMIISHRYEDRFTMDKKPDAETGEVSKFKMKGYKDITYVTQVHIEHLKDYASRDLQVRIVECRQNNRAEKLPPFEVDFVDDLTADMMGMPHGSSTGGTFYDIATAVFPNTKESDWLDE